MKDRLIVFEGIDGAGKSTQVRLLAKHMRARGVHVTVFDIPRYKTSWGKLVKDALTGQYGDFLKVSPYLAALPYALDRAAAAVEIKAALKKGMVICNRYTPSNIAFQGAKIRDVRERAAFTRMIEKLEYTELGIPRPDTIIFLDTPVQTAQRFMRSKDRDQHERDVAYQKKVVAAYRTLAKGKGWKTVQTRKAGRVRAPEQIHRDILQAVQ